MNKDVIYIDVDDDITAIIGKVKDSKEKIVALVPPKRIGVLQSAVNLRLLARAATQGNKHLVLISSNSALLALAAAAKVPVAKTLQSKPELPEIDALDVDDGEDIIDGSQLPIGDHAKTAKSPDSAIERALQADAAADAKKAAPPLPGEQPARPRAKSGVKVPNFNSFRKKLFLIIGGGVLLVAFLVWAIFFAPRATIVITARTSDTSSNAAITLAQSLTTDASKNTLKATTQQLKKEISVEFAPTGKKQVGDKATGTMKLTRTSTSSVPINVPSGTSFSSSGRTFVSTESATLGGTTVGEGGIIQSSATVAVQATEVGEEYNLSARGYQSNISGFDAQGSTMAGGTSKEITVVSSSDVDAATQQLKQQNNDQTKSDLKAQFDKTVKILDSTFKVDLGTPTSTPAVDQEASGKAKLTANATYSITGVDSSEYNRFLDSYFDSKLTDKNAQRVYSNGGDKVQFTNVNATDNGYTANIVATAKVGPKIDDNTVKEQSKGKRYGDIQSSLASIQGVDNVDVKFWPFWVSTVPNDANRITVEFNLDEK
ncbi:MAG TPA: hypothetical protein VJ841_00860 [Candidatus Saccharimonadales bacterium]|nr:hypothetical protein [Candidatus Saccharimonadales bacterium]